MFKRVTWFGVGVVVGAAASKWVEVKARRRLARYFPARRLTLRTSPEVDGSGGLGAVGWRRAKSQTSGDAVEGGRSAMVIKEAELRRRAPARWTPGRAAAD